MDNKIFVLTEDDTKELIECYFSDWSDTKKSACITYVGAFIDFEFGVEGFYKACKTQLEGYTRLSVWEAVIMLAIVDFIDDYEDEISRDIEAEEHLQNIRDGWQK